MKRVNINELKTGMYVAGVIGGDNRLTVKQYGLVKSDLVIQALKKKGILKVVIDTDKDTQKVNGKAVITEPTVEAKPHKRSSLFDDLNALKQLFKEAKAVQHNIAQKVHDKKALDIQEIEHITGQLVNAVIDSDEALWFMTRIRQQDAYLLEHSLNVGVLLGLFAKFLGFEVTLINDLVLGGFLHDIGKLLIPAKILNKPGKLTESEYRVMQGHVMLSREIIARQYADISVFSMVALANHHEKMDGSGYPYGKTGDDIPFFGKMITIVDVFDAITAKRCYKSAIPNIAALRILHDGSGKSFDPYLVAEFIKFIGTYPAGTLVALSSNNRSRLAIVESKNDADPLKPIVKAFYNINTRNYMAIESINLARPQCPFEIKQAVTAEEYNINMEELVERCF